MRRIYLFGGGAYLKKRIDKIKTLPDTEIRGIVDNNPLLWGTEIAGISVFTPKCLIESEYDLIVVTSLQGSIIDDLRKVGLPNEKILTFDQYVGFCYKGKFTRCGKVESKGVHTQKTVLLLTQQLGFNGGSIAAAYASLALQEQGYKVGIVSTDGEEEMIAWLADMGISVWVYPNLKFDPFSDINGLPQWDAIIVNTFQMHHCIDKMPADIPIIWWLHESVDVYIQEAKLYGYHDIALQDNVSVYCVSRRAQLNFKQFYPDIPSRVLEYGIPDVYSVKQKKVDSDKIVFGVIGAICEIKGQDVLLDALMLLDSNTRSRIEVMLIGAVSESSYCKKVKKMAKKLPMVRIIGEVPHEKIMEYLADLDVVVCPSRQETLSIAITEALMMGKFCIISDVIGMMDYVRSGEDVLAFTSENAEELVDRIKEIIMNPSMKMDFARKARGAYERTFSMERFARRLGAALLA